MGMIFVLRSDAAYPVASGVAFSTTPYLFVARADRTPVRASGGSNQQLAERVPGLVGDRMFHPARFVMDRSPVDMENVGEEYFKETVPALDGLGDLSPLVGEGRPLIPFIPDEPLIPQALERLGHARGGNVHAFRDRRRLCRAVFSFEIIDRFEVFLDLLLRHSKY